MTHRGIVIKTVVTLLAIGLGVFLLLNYLAKPKLTDKTPAFEAKLLNGTPLSLEKYHGKPLIIYFWSTWCPTCKYQSPMIDTLSRDYQVLTVCVYSGTDRQIRDYLDKTGYTFDVINDYDNRVRRTFKVKALPTTFVLNSEGRIIFSEVGMMTGLGLRLRVKLTD